MAHAYLSASPDNDNVAALVQGELEARGHHVWRTTSDIAEGENWEEAAKEALANCYAVVVVVSVQGARSPWVRWEVEHAPADVPIVAVQWERTDLPEHLTGLTAVDFGGVREGSGIEHFQRFRDAMTELVDALDEARPLRLHIERLGDAVASQREEAATELGHLGDTEACGPLIGVLADTDADVRFAAVESIGRLGCNAADKELVATLDDPDPDVAAAAARALGVVGDEEVVDPLIHHLTHHDRFVRAESIRALGRLEANEAASLIVNLMRNDPIKEVRDAAEEALQIIDSPVARRALTKSRSL